MWEYSEKVKDHFSHPRNVGEVKDPDAVGEVGNIACGDALKLTLKIDKPTSRIVDARFKTFGCGSAIASASALTEMIKGKTIDEASKITNEDIARYLDGLPEEKMHCSVMGRDALEAAIANYRGGKVIAPANEGKIICKCFGVTDKKIARVVRENRLTTVSEVTNYTKAGGGCKSCHPEIKDIISSQLHKKPFVGKLTNIRKIGLIKETIEREIRPALQADGGDIELIDIIGDRVLIAFRGTCAGCPSSGVTLKSSVEAKLREFVSENLAVEEVEK
ncbi:MAG: Fe-S cluster assembly protein NifU [Candidatus Omnitrophica bacterium]|nr:Fe-S cluster assembly protein NifU [Candidatus Omnitrophota bacterium]